MGRKFSIFIPCEEANHICDKNQYKEASLREKINLNLHLIYCQICRKYSSDNYKLTKALKKSKIDYLNKEEKQAMKQTVDNEIEKHAI